MRVKPMPTNLYKTVRSSASLILIMVVLLFSLKSSAQQSPDSSAGKNAPNSKPSITDKKAQNIENTEKAEEAAELLKIALEAFKRRQRAEGYARLSQAISLDGSNSEIHLILARELYRDGMLERAEDSFKTALRLEPDNTEASEAVDRIRVERYEKLLTDLPRSEKMEKITIDFDGSNLKDAVFTKIVDLQAGDKDEQLGIHIPERGRPEGPQAYCEAVRGAFLITDNVKHRILRLDENGKIIQEFGSKGRNSGGLYLPFDIAEDSDNGIFILDDPRTDLRLIRFDNDGNYKWEKRLNDPTLDYSFLQFNRISLSGDKIFIYGLTSRGFKMRIFDMEGKYLYDRKGQMADFKGNTWQTEGIRLSLLCFDDENKLRRVYECADFEKRYRALGVVGITENHIWLSGLLLRTGRAEGGTRPVRKGWLGANRWKSDYGVAEIIKMNYSGIIEAIYKYPVTREGNVPHARRMSLYNGRPVLFQVDKNYSSISYMDE